MKTILSLIIAMMMVSFANAQTVDYKNIYAKNEKLAKLAKEARSAKASKDAKKEAKRMEKEGWKPMPGKLPIARQLDMVYNKQYELDDQGRMKFIYGSAAATGSSIVSAQTAAVTAARNQIAGSMSTSVTALIDVKIENSEISTTEAATLHETAEKCKQIFSQNLGLTTAVLEVYRELPNGMAQVQVGVTYSSAEAMRIIRETVKKEMGNDIDSKLFD